MIYGDLSSELSSLERRIDYIDFELRREIESIRAEIEEIKELGAMIDDLEARISELERQLKAEVVR